MPDTTILEQQESTPLAVGPYRFVETTVEPIENDNFQFSPKSAKVMIIDDELINIELIQLYLDEAGFKNFSTANDSQRAMEQMKENPPDVVLLDLMMPHSSGFDIVSEMRADKKLKLIPVIISTAVCRPDVKLKALELGVNDFLNKPVDPSELVLRLRNTLAAKALQDYLTNVNSQLEHQVRMRTAELEASRQEAMYCLARAAEYRDDDTGQHVIRVGRYVALIADHMGYPPAAIPMLEQAAQLHDVGKIGIPDALLLKKGKLDPSEFEYMKRHCQYGKKIIQPMNDDEWNQLRRNTSVGASILETPSSPIMKLAAVIAETHHEKWNGSGYPNGLSGEDIPLEGRITAIADVFDALSNERPYKKAFPIERCLTILEEGRGTHFDPDVLNAFLASLSRVLEVKASFADNASY